MEKLVKDFLQQKRFAVVGSFKNESKYAYKILKTLKQKGYTVYPVNPHIKAVDNTVCYPSITDIPGGVDVVDLVTPPEVSEKIVKECTLINVARVWFQPGAESDSAIRYCKNNNIDIIYNLCVMLESA